MYQQQEMYEEIPKLKLLYYKWEHVGVVLG